MLLNLAVLAVLAHPKLEHLFSETTKHGFGGLFCGTPTSCLYTLVGVGGFSDFGGSDL